MISCNSDDENNHSPSYYNLETGVEFKVSSPTGVDLLNPNNANAYLAENIKIYYLRNSEIEEIYNPNMTSPRNFSIISPEDTGEDFYFIGVGLNSYGLENTITYIEWNDTDTDTIRANFISGDNYTVITKAWYNEELIFDKDIIPETVPEIIKD
ncbi:hypothetical protein DI383_09070 [Flavobacteriaceae bacterium LYZ1037]|nr:hypothetical protein DI383_09070 [Flavobacteriaceae bacterium LYZ1037]